MLRKLYDRMMRLAASPQGPWWLALEAFCEGIFFPIPADLMLMPMVLARPERAWRYAAITLISSVIGGSVGFAIGFLLKDVALWLLTHTGMSVGMVASVRDFLQHGGWGYLLLVIPIPYKLIAIGSGLIPLNYLLFLLASVIIRGARFFLVAGLMRRYGPSVQGFVEKRLTLIACAVAILIIAAVLALKLVH